MKLTFLQIVGDRGDRGAAFLFPSHCLTPPTRCRPVALLLLALSFHSPIVGGNVYSQKCSAVKLQPAFPHNEDAFGPRTVIKKHCCHFRESERNRPQNPDFLLIIAGLACLLWVQNIKLASLTSLLAFGLKTCFPRFLRMTWISGGLGPRHQISHQH